MAIEIEVKARVKDRDALVQKLSALGCEFSQQKTQDDSVYAEKTGSLDTFLSNKVFLRIRIQNGTKMIFTAKRPKGDARESLIKQEHEVTVNSAEELRGILALIGYSEAVRVKKVRKSASYNGYEICIDDIEGLGTFIEVEAIGDEESAEKTQAELWQFLGTLGIAPEDQVKKGYDILMLEKGAET